MEANPTPETPTKGNGLDPEAPDLGGYSHVEDEGATVRPPRKAPKVTSLTQHQAEAFKHLIAYAEEHGSESVVIGSRSETHAYLARVTERHLYRCVNTFDQLVTKGYLVADETDETLVVVNTESMRTLTLGLLGAALKGAPKALEDDDDEEEETSPPPPTSAEEPQYEYDEDEDEDEDGDEGDGDDPPGPSGAEPVEAAGTEYAPMRPRLRITLEVTPLSQGPLRGVWRWGDDETPELFFKKVKRWQGLLPADERCDIFLEICKPKGGRTLKDNDVCDKESFVEVVMDLMEEIHGAFIYSVADSDEFWGGPKEPEVVEEEPPPPPPREPTMREKVAAGLHVKGNLKNAALAINDVAAKATAKFQETGEFTAISNFVGHPDIQKLFASDAATNLILELLGLDETRQVIRVVGGKLGKVTEFFQMMKQGQIEGGGEL